MITKEKINNISQRPGSFRESKKKLNLGEKIYENEMKMKEKEKEKTMEKLKIKIAEENKSIEENCTFKPNINKIDIRVI